MNTTRKYWLDTMLKIVSPVVEALAENRLKKDMPVESIHTKKSYSQWEYLEVLGRVTVGIAPWLSCQGLKGEEEELRKHYASLMRTCIKNAVDEDSADYIDFTPYPNRQPIVDAAFLAQGILRAPDELWTPLDDVTKEKLLKSIRRTRTQKPHKNNWLLFAAMIESLLYYAGADDWDPMRIDYALEKHMDWYKGDGWYGDGEKMHFDYYNSLVIQPMLVDVINTVGDYYPSWSAMKDSIHKRASHFATHLEHMIAPDGSYPPIGRSITYRFGSFHLLAQMAYLDMLEEEISPSQVRCALTAVIKKICSFPDMFDDKGWLRLGVCGYQPRLAERYISTASLYLCSSVFLPLGLNESATFWSEADADWTSKRFWAGENLPCEHALD